MKQKIIVIGSGFGGLASGIRLAAAGHTVEIFEKSDKPGGRAYVFEINGFKFDAGPTVITAPFLLKNYSALPGRRAKIILRLKLLILSTGFLTTKKNTSIIILILILP